MRCSLCTVGPLKLHHSIDNYFSWMTHNCSQKFDAKLECDARLECENQTLEVGRITCENEKLAMAVDMPLLLISSTFEVQKARRLYTVQFCKWIVSSFVFAIRILPTLMIKMLLFIITS